uniref:Uncharacterized protein n=1 Tax=Cucumis melo TaxID=3656 RepID=A0A9I9EMB9_CUCME
MRQEYFSRHISTDDLFDVGNDVGISFPDVEIVVQEPDRCLQSDMGCYSNTLSFIHEKPRITIGSQVRLCYAVYHPLYPSVTPQYVFNFLLTPFRWILQDFEIRTLVAILIISLVLFINYNYLSTYRDQLK